MKPIVLASTSPRRRSLLEQAGISFSVMAPDCDEHIEKKSPEEYVMELSAVKCRTAAGEISYPALVIGADTIVYHKGQILGKPEDESQAQDMLRSLSDDTHQVYTGVTIIDTGTKREKTFAEKTDVTFYPLEEEEILNYIATGEPMDKAGAYGIQGKGVFLVSKIHGDYNNVVGLPVARLLRELKGM